MTCPYCGGKNAAGDQFCRTCGRTLLDGPIPFTDPEPAFPPPEVENEAAAPVVLTLEPPSPSAGEEAAFSTRPPPLTEEAAAPDLPPVEEPPVPDNPPGPDLPPFPPPPPASAEDWPDEEYGADEDGAPLPLYPPRWPRAVLLPLLLSLALFLATTAAGLSTALTLGGCGGALRAAAPGLPLSLLSPLRLMAGLSSPAAAAGFWLLAAGLALALFRLASRPLAAWRWLGPALALGGLLLLLAGIRFSAFTSLLPGSWAPLLSALERDNGLSWRIFVAGVSLLAAGLVVLLSACAVRRGPAERRGLSLALLTLCALLLFSSASATLSGAYTATAGTLTRSVLLSPPEDPALDKARAADREGDHQQVLELLSGLPSDATAEIPLLLARSHMALNDPDNALAVLRQGLEQFPRDAALSAAMADALTALGNRAAVAAASDRARIDKAISYYQEAQRYAPENTTLSLAILALNEMAAQYQPAP